MSYALSPNHGAGSSNTKNPSPQDACGNPRNVSLLNGVTPASIQERLEEAMKDSQRRRSETKQIHEENMAQPPMQREDAGPYWGPAQTGHLNNPNQLPMPQPPMHDSYTAKPPVSVRKAIKYMPMPAQFADREVATKYQFVDPPSAHGHEQRHVGGQMYMWNQNGPAAMTQHRYGEAQQVDFPADHFPRFVTIAESYSSTATNYFPNHAMHRHKPREMQTPIQHNTTYRHPPDSGMHYNGAPQTTTEMNHVLNMPKGAVPYADQFQFRMPASRKLLRRTGSLGPGDSVSQTSSGGYRGHPASGIRNLASNLNCALWLTNLHPHVQPREVFDKIHTGAVSAFEIARPKGFFVMSAAKLVFKHPAAAARFVILCGSGAIWIRGRKVEARYNHFGQLRYWGSERTRVLCVEGPTKYVDYEGLKRYFESFCEHELSHWETRASSIPGHRKLIWEFVRIDGQARQCFEALKVHPVYGKVLTVSYAPDPCGRIYP
ncbi:hypothetical protein DSL72_006856 [Monilinia vaccinii-corymbosi]|uniref:RRM domain-containing protein n=1 Tax=Monilinia vaccinii-corymbosi TaxID=61207 RepID=A0A8A3PL94_9HELO|nr:hypothetical protein DSL72_006856 [Monilinia vaccinii-corymbosi]